MTDDKNTASLDELISAMESPSIDPKAKKRALNLAMAEFNQQYYAQNNNTQSEHKTNSFENIPNKTQGFWSWLRPISYLLMTNRKNIMATLNNKLLYSGLATLSVAVIGISLFQQTYRPSLDPTITIIGEESNSMAQLKINKLELRRPQDPLQATKGQISVENKIEDHSRLTSADEGSPGSTALAAVSSGASDDSRTPHLNTSERSTSRQNLTDNTLLQTQVSKPSPNKDELAGIVNQLPSVLPQTKTSATPQRLTALNSVAVVTNHESNQGVANKSIRAESDIQALDIISQPGFQEQGRDNFESIELNTIKLTSEEPVSTFSIDVDTASYSFVRSQLNQGLLPQKDAVRIEEMINYFDYAYPLARSSTEPFKPTILVQPSPWNQGKKLIHVGIKGYDITPDQQPRSNLVLLLDVSGSMNSPDKLPLVKRAMGLLLDTLQPEDTIAIVVYAGAAGLVLEPTAAKEKQTILRALNRLNAGGSTAGGQGIKLAYQLAEANFSKDAVNRIILATDGDFNVGIRNSDELKGFVERKRDQGIFLSVLGFGQGNYNDQLMQALAQNGNGIAAYIDSVAEAQKVLIDEATSMLFPIAKDVKIQIEFNPNKVSEYRLVGYETRQLNREDFNNDKVDAGDIGAGHTVTVIYEITPKLAGVSVTVDPLRYEDNLIKSNRKEGKAAGSEEKTVSLDLVNHEYGFLKIRYKLPTQDISRLITQAIISNEFSLNDLSLVELKMEADFASAVAGFAQLLKGGKYLTNYTYDDVINAALKSRGDDVFGYRAEFIQLVRSAKTAAAIQ
jgi:Ca-activated chloride channel family protein